MIVDSSALIAIILNEPEQDAFAAEIMMDEAPTMSAASYVECALRLDGQLTSGQDARLDAAIVRLGIVLCQ